MTTIDLFFQGEGFGEIKHLEIEPDTTCAIFKARVSEIQGVARDVLVFLEDEDDPIADDVLLKEHAAQKGMKVHVHRCRHVEVAVTFNGETVDHRFGPAATIARIKRWAAERKFGMSEEDAGEHALQISGTHERPALGIHIGSLTTCEACALSFDLVADERVNGAFGSLA